MPTGPKRYYGARDPTSIRTTTLNKIPEKKTKVQGCGTLN